MLLLVKLRRGFGFKEVTLAQARLHSAPLWQSESINIQRKKIDEKKEKSVVGDSRAKEIIINRTSQYIEVKRR